MRVIVQCPPCLVGTGVGPTIFQVDVADSDVVAALRLSVGSRVGKELTNEVFCHHGSVLDDTTALSSLRHSAQGSNASSATDNAATPPAVVVQVLPPPAKRSQCRTVGQPSNCSCGYGRFMLTPTLPPLDILVHGYEEGCDVLYQILQHPTCAAELRKLFECESCGGGQAVTQAFSDFVQAVRQLDSKAPADLLNIIKLIPDQSHDVLSRIKTYLERSVFDTSDSVLSLKSNPLTVADARIMFTRENYEAFTELLAHDARSGAAAAVGVGQSGRRRLSANNATAPNWFTPAMMNQALASIVTTPGAGGAAVGSSASAAVAGASSSTSSANTSNTTPGSRSNSAAAAPTATGAAAGQGVSGAPAAAPSAGTAASGPAISIDQFQQAMAQALHGAQPSSSPSSRRHRQHSSGDDHRQQQRQQSEASRSRYAEELTTMQHMGLSNDRINLTALIATEGDVNAACELVMSGALS